ncbi:MAG: polyprenyl synthetase family protein [Acidobacteria bacterium]|nr:polyprenyl synthetase family protein [Acidobacteriota bacterium]
MTQRLESYIEKHRTKIEQALNSHLPVSHQGHAARMNEALRYAIFPGGKRWRPILTLLGAQLFEADPERSLASACAMEYLHTSSMIFDDLPAMDDAGLRRGRASLHLAFGEGLALLAALALFNKSYALLARSASDNGFPASGVILVEEAVRCIGSDGMIGGQVVDLALKGAGQSAESLASRNLKTTALLRLTMVAGAASCGATPAEVEPLARFGEALGMAYQICDDLLDELVSSDDLGKPAQQDSRHLRSNYAVELGVDGAHRMASDLVESALLGLRDAFRESVSIDLIADATRLILNGMGKLTSTFPKISMRS